MTVDKATVLTRLSAAVAAADGQPLATRLCAVCLEVTAADACAITLGYADADRVTVAATNRAAARLEDLQELIGEGPGWDADRAGAMVTGMIGDHLNVDDQRWPIFSNAAAEQTGPVIVSAFPMRPNGRQIVGIITLYQLGEQPQPIHTDATQFLVDAVGAALLHDPTWDDDTGQQDSWPDRAKIHQATGMVIAQLAIPAGDALALMRAHAYAHTTTLDAIAADILHRRLDFSQLINDRNEPT